MAGGNELDEPAEFVGGGRRAGKTVLLLRQSQEHESELSVLGKEMLAGEITEGGERFGHPRPRRDVATRARIGRAATGLEARQQAFAVAFQGSQRRLLHAGCGLASINSLRRAGDHLPGKSADHRRHLQVRPAAREDRLGPFDELVDRREISGRKIVQPLGTDLRQVDLVEHRAEAFAVLRDFPR